MRDPQERIQELLEACVRFEDRARTAERRLKELEQPIELTFVIDGGSTSVVSNDPRAIGRFVHVVDYGDDGDVAIRQPDGSTVRAFVWSAPVEQSRIEILDFINEEDEA